MQPAFAISEAGHAEARSYMHSVLSAGVPLGVTAAGNEQDSPSIRSLVCGVFVPIGVTAMMKQRDRRVQIINRRKTKTSTLSMHAGKPGGQAIEEPSRATRLSSIHRLTEGLTTGSKTHYQESLECWPGNVASWVMLGDTGGGVVNETVYDMRACAEKALSLNSCSSTAWLLLGKAGGGRVNGEFRTALFCFESSLSIDDTSAANWLALGTIGGGHINGRKFTSNACFKLALRLDPLCRTAWLFSYVAGEVAGDAPQGMRCLEKVPLESKNATLFSSLSSAGSREGDLALKLRLQAALSTDPVNAEAWQLLGYVGGARIGERHYSAAQCYENALDILFKNSLYDPNGLDDALRLIIARQTVKAWCGLMSEGGGQVCGISYHKATCHQMALEISPALVDDWSKEQQLKQSEQTRSIEAMQEAIESTGQWFQLGLGLKGTKGEKACYELALEAEPRNCAAWQKLAELGGGCVGGQVFEETECVENSLTMVFDDK